MERALNPGEPEGGQLPGLQKLTISRELSGDNPMRAPSPMRGQRTVKAQLLEGMSCKCHADLLS